MVCKMKMSSKDKGTFCFPIYVEELQCVYSVIRQQQSEIKHKTGSF